jgi:hypothetical protein
VPNCNFYATPEDHRGILEWLFAEQRCHVFELSSDFDTALRQFYTAEEVLTQFERCYTTGERWHTVHLSLYVLGGGPKFTPERITLNPGTGGTFRYTTSGWGLIQLYLEAPQKNKLASSYTNHNSQKRAEAWADTCPEMGSPDLWDFAKITSFSSRLNRFIKKQGVEKQGNRAILTGAMSFAPNNLVC